MKVLVIEDHSKLRENIIKFLKLSNFIAEGAFNGQEALNKISLTKYDLLILDVNMPLMDGRELIKVLRKKGNNIPVIALTSNSMLEDKLEMFDFGVDDYLTKPFEFKELEARIKALLKRKDKYIEKKIKIGNIVIDLQKHKIYKQDYISKKYEEIEFGNKHFLIIEFLAINRGIVKSKVQILEKVWGEAEENLDLNSTTLETHISVIRKKLGKDFIKTVKGVGYVIE